MKSNKPKKLLSLLLAVAMVFSVSVTPALAADTSSLDTETVIDTVEYTAQTVAEDEDSGSSSSETTSEGTSSEETTSEDTSSTSSDDSSESYVASVTVDDVTTYYDSLADAVAAVSTDGTATTIKMIAGSTESASITVASGQNITLDLNGCTVDMGGYTLISEGTLTITDSTATTDPEVSTDYETVTYTSGKITSTGTTVCAQSGGTVTLASGTVESTKNIALYAQGDLTGESTISSTVNMTGGYAVAQEYTASPQGKGATLNISGGVLVSNDNAVVGGNGSSGRGGTTITISGGTLIGHIQSSGYVACGIYHPQEGTLTITGGTIYADGGCGVLMRGGTLEMTGGTIIATSTAEGKVGDSRVVVTGAGIVYDYDSGYYDVTNVEITISGGSITGGDGAISVVDTTGDGTSSSVISITGGTFSSDVSAYVADSAKSTYSGTTYTVSALTATDEESIASVTASDGTVTYYNSLSAALAAAEDGETVTLLADVTLTANGNFSSELRITSGDVVIDLNGHNIDAGSITYPIYIASGASLTINDGEGTGVITVAGTYGVYAAGTFNMTGGTISGSSSGATVYIAGSINMTGGTVKSSGDTGIWLNGATSASLSNCTVKTTYTGWGYGVYCSSCTGAVTMNNVTIDASSTNCCGLVLLSYTTATLTDCNIHTNGWYCIANNGADSAVTLTIDGGTYTADDCTAIFLPNYNATTTISNATITGATGIEIRGGTLVLNDCIVTGNNSSYIYQPSGSGNTVYGPAIAISQHTTDETVSVTITGGTYTATNAPAVAQLNLNSGTSEDVSKISLTITDGTFTGYSEDDSNSTAIALESVATESTAEGTVTGMSVSISGGIYSSDVDSAYIAEYYKSATYDATTGTYQVVASCAATVTVNGETTTYKTLAAAVDAANAASNDATITLLCDASLDSSITFSNTNAAITLDLNGYDITRGDNNTTAALIYVTDGTVTVQDTSVNADGTIYSANYSVTVDDTTTTYAGYGIIISGGTVNVNSGTVAGYRAIYGSAGTLNITGGTVSGTQLGVVADGTLIVNVSDNAVITAAHSAIYTWDNTYTGTTNITGGTIGDTSTTYAVNARAGTVNIIGGTITGTTAGVIAVNGANVVIGVEGSESGPTITGTYEAVEISTSTTATASSTVTVYSGTLSGTSYGICIYGKNSTYYSQLNVYGGTITADTYFAITGNGSTGQGYDIIYIYGGTITSNNGQAIYLPQQDGYTYIYGGTITGDTGIEIRGGTVIIDDKADDTAPLYIYATGDPTSSTGNTSGSTTSGAAIAIATYNLSNIDVTIASGTFEGASAIYESNPNNTSLTYSVSVTVTGGTYTGEVYSEDEVIDISGGTFDETVTIVNCADGYYPTTTTVDGVTKYTVTQLILGASTDTETETTSVAASSIDGYGEATMYVGVTGSLISNNYNTTKYATTSLEYSDNGYIFAGWYTATTAEDGTVTYTACSSSLWSSISSEDTTVYYAKFVDADVLKVGFQYVYSTSQTTTPASSDDTTVYLRLVSTVDTVNYQQTGFVVTFTQGDTTKTYDDLVVTTVYPELVGTTTTYSPTDFSSASKYFSTYVINKVPVSSDLLITVYVYWITTDGTRVQSTLTETYSGKDMSNGLAITEIVGSSSGTTSTTES